MRRSFLPVGQGAFYLERFDKRTFGTDAVIIYDCGSLTGVDRVKEQIENCLKKDEKVDAVFLSHLHADHINGLPYLLQHCDVKKIYFPLVTAANRQVLRMDQIIKGKDKFTNDFIDDPYSAVKKYARESMPELVLVQAAGDQNSIDNISLNMNRRVVPSGANVAEDIWGKANEKIPWVFVPYNFEVDSKALKIMEQLRNEGIGIETVDDIDRVWRNAGADVRKRIKKIFGVRQEVNINSMVLFSGETARTMRQKRDAENDGMPSGCLYTGDYNAKSEAEWRTLKESYKKYWAYVGCVQIPHHGSKYSFNKEFLKLKHCCYIVSAGSVNKFDHPHAEVMKNFLIENKQLYLASEINGQTLKIY